jgi:microsomal dipeptidase-like Zn-dependent dipeptidase
VADIKAWAARPENRTWVEIALTPAHARRIIAANKLAIVLGLELDALGNFVPNDRWREPHAVVMPGDDHPAEQRRLIAGELDGLYEQGVRQVGPFHYMSGVFGGCAMFQRLFNEVNRKMTGNNVHVLSGDSEGIRYRLDMDAWDAAGMASRTLVTGDLPDRQTDPTWEPTRLGHVNAMGLTQAGEIVFDEMARRGMLVDIDHASNLAAGRLMQLATARDYPLMSSHTDFAELGFTGMGDFTHGPYLDNDAENFAAFDTTILAPLRHEGQATRTKVETIARLEGVTGAILWLSRRLTWGHAIPNDCDGSTKTWAQSYQYAVDRTGGRGVALSTDRITIEPRFGPNAAYPLGLEHAAFPLRDQRRFRQVDAQLNGVRYDIPIKEWRAFRFAPAAGSAWDKTPFGDVWEEKSWEHQDAWKAIAAWAAGRNPRTMPDHGIEQSGDPLHAGRIINYAWGLWSSNETELESDCGVLGCDAGTIAERYGAYCAKTRISPYVLAHHAGGSWIVENHRWVTTVWNEWQHMTGTNDPLRRHLFGISDYDVNIDGVAHYGMLPDFLQDVANSHPRPAEVGTYFEPLFSSAESYIHMWEKARTRAGRRADDP